MSNALNLKSRINKTLKLTSKINKQIDLKSPINKTLKLTSKIRPVRKS